MAAATEIFWIGGALAVAQINTETPATVEVDDIFTLTLSDDAGNSHLITFTATAATVANVVTGLYDAAVVAEAAGYRPWTDVDCADDTTTLTITAETAGTRFYVATTATDGGVADTQTLTDANTTANSGPSDFLCGENWSSGASPAADDLLTFPSTVTGSVLYGLTATTAYAGIVVAKDCALAIGHARQSLVVTLDDGDSGSEVRLAGTGQKFLYFASGADDIYINQSAGDRSGLPGTVIETAGTVDYDVYVNIASGQSVGFGMREDKVIKIDAMKQDGGGKVILGDGVTDAPSPEVNDGILETHCNLTTATFRGRSWTHYEGTATTINMVAGTTTLLSEDLAAGTVLNLYGPARVMFGPRAGAAQFTTMDVSGEHWWIEDPFARVLQYEMNQCAPSDGRLMGPKNMEWDVSAIA